MPFNETTFNTGTFGAPQAAATVPQPGLGKVLATARSVWTAVFRRIVLQLTTDAALTTVVPSASIRSWDGTADDKSLFAPGVTGPVIRLTPRPEHVDWYSPDTQEGTLLVKVEMVIATTCIDDPIDLWEVVVNAILPDVNSLASDLKALGAETGEIVFSDPAVDAHPDAKPAGEFYAVGYFALKVLRTIA